MRAFSWFVARTSQDPGNLGKESGHPGGGGDGCEGDPKLPRGKAGALRCGHCLPQPRAWKRRRGADTALAAPTEPALARRRQPGSMSLAAAAVAVAAAAAATAAAAASAAWDVLG